MSMRKLGRPSEIEGGVRARGSNYSFYLSENQIKALDEVHWRERKSVSEIVREAIDEWLKNHAEGNTTFSLDNWQENPEFKAVPTLLSTPEKWSKYIDECSDYDCTQIGIMSNKVHQIVKMRRDKEYRERNKRT